LKSRYAAGVGWACLAGLAWLGMPGWACLAGHALPTGLAQSAGLWAGGMSLANRVGGSVRQWFLINHTTTYFV